MVIEDDSLIVMMNVQWCMNAWKAQKGKLNNKPQLITPSVGDFYSYVQQNWTSKR